MDIVLSKQTNPQIYDEFNQGKFVVHKTHRSFSGLAINQADKQLE